MAWNAVGNRSGLRDSLSRTSSDALRWFKPTTRNSNYCSSRTNGSVILTLCTVNAGIPAAISPFRRRDRRRGIDNGSVVGSRGGRAPALVAGRGDDVHWLQMVAQVAQLAVHQGRAKSESDHRQAANRYCEGGAYEDS